MRRASFWCVRLLLTGVLVAWVAASAACGSGSSSSSTPTAPTTPAPPPAPAPAPPPEPAPPPPPPAPAALSSLTLSSGSVVGQQQPTATVTLTAPAPSAGAVVRLETTNQDVAKVPSTVTVPAGASSVTFRVDTSTVPTRTVVTLTATYSGVARTTELAVTLPTPRASFTVTSPTRGTDACVLIEAGALLDCRLDARGSEGVLTRWMWVFTAVERFLANKVEPTFVEIDTGGCRFVNGASPQTDSDGRKYINITILLEVMDRDGTQSAPTTRTVRLYTNDYCGI